MFHGVTRIDRDAAVRTLDRLYKIDGEYAYHNKEYVKEGEKVNERNLKEVNLSVDLRDYY